MKKAALAAVIEDWLEKTGKTIHYLSEKADVGYSTIRKILDQKCEASLGTALNLLLCIFKNDPMAMHRFVQEHYPELGHYTSRLVEAQPRVVEDLHLTPATCRAMVEICCTSKGVPEKEVERLLGANGADFLSTMLERGDFKRTEEGNITGSSRVLLILSNQQQKLFAHWVIDNIIKKHPGNMMHFVAEGLNDKGTAAYYAALEECADRLLDIINDKSNHGDNRIVSTLGMTII